MIATLVSDGVAYDMSRCRVQIPAFGLWWCDAELSDAVELAVGSAALISVADIQLTATVVAGGAANGRSSFRLVGGHGGWRSVVPAKGYYDSAGVSVAALITELASTVGEEVADIPIGRVSEHYARCSVRASQILSILAPNAWHVGLDGVTRFGSRAVVQLDRTDTRVEIFRAQARVDLAVESLADLIPGCVIDGLAVTDVEYELTASRLIARCFGGSKVSRDTSSLVGLLDALDPNRVYRCAYNYRVVSCANDRVSVQPVRSSSGMPDLEDVPVRLAPGLRAKNILGSLVTVVFLDSDPSQPVVISGDGADAVGWDSTETLLSADLLRLGASTATLGVARVGDAVQAGPYVGVITGASSRVLAS
jgi:hypothetical protein